MSLKILAADTALGACSAAVVDGDAVLARCFVTMERGHAETLAPMVEETMREAGLAFADLDRLAVTTGPGTFTGQRVGLAFMRGLRLALKKPLVGITTLDAMAAAAMDETKTDRAAVLHDAKRGEVYALAVAGRTVLVPLQLATFEDAVSAIANAGLPSRAPLAFAGTAGEAAAERYRAAGGLAVLASVRQPDALWVARLAAEADEPAGIPKPLYLRAPDAKLPPSAGGIRLRTATASDIPALARMHSDSFADGWSAQYLAALLNAPNTFAVVAEAAGVPLGFVLVRVAADEAEILTIAVAPAFRRKGIGKSLLAAGAAKARIKGAVTMFLEVARNNAVARALYAATGFSEAGSRPGYYKNTHGAPEDALILKARLPLELLGNGPEVD